MHSVTPSARPGSPAVVLLSGLVSDDVVWDAQRDAFSREFTVHMFHFPEHDSLAAMAAEVLRTVPGSFSLAGHSMGGRVAFEAFRQAPTRIERLALLNTGVHPRAPGEVEKRMVLVDRARESGVEALVTDWLPPMISPARRQDHALVDPLSAMVRRATPDSFARQIKALIDRPDATPLLAQITCPTLVATGDQDSWAPIAQHATMAAALPASTLVEFPQCGHFSTMEQPQRVTDALAAWLRTTAR